MSKREFKLDWFGLLDILSVPFIGYWFWDGWSGYAYMSSDTGLWAGVLNVVIMAFTVPAVLVGCGFMTVAMLGLLGGFLGFFRD